MTDLHDHANGIGSFASCFLEVRVREMNVTDNELFGLCFDQVADIVSMFRKHKDTVGDEVGNDAVDCEAQANKAGQESFGVLDPVLVEEIAYVLCRRGCIFAECKRDDLL